MAWVDFSNTAGWPLDGKGRLGSTSTSYTTDDTLFTATTVTGPTFLATLTNAAAGFAIATSDGFWGIIQSVDAAASPDVITVDRWRKWGYPGSAGTPAANSDVKVLTALYGRTCERWVIDALEIRKGTAADTITLSDAFGTAVTTWTVGATAGPLLIPYSRGVMPYEGVDGWDVGGPFQVVTSAATTICTVHFRIISGK